MSEQKAKMKKVLMYDNRKCNPEIWDVSTPELKSKAFLNLFKLLDEDWEVYSDLVGLEEPKKPSMSLEQIAQLPEGRVRSAAEEEHKEYETDLEEYKLSKEQKKLYDLAKKGDANAAQTLLTRRRDYEYETWQIRDVNQD
jgi:hypothetical protein